MKFAPDSPWRGIYPAMVTPLKPDETLDEAAAATLVSRLMDQGMAGLYLTGSTGESFAIEDDVRLAMYPIAAEAAGGRGRLVAHVGGVHLKRALRMVRVAEESGFAAISAVAPYGTRYDMDVIQAYYRELARESALPLIVYHLPAFTGYDMTIDEISAILECDNVIGVKYTEYNMFFEETLIHRFPEKAVFNGADESLLSALAIGATGAIGSNWNVLGTVANALAEAFWSGDLAAAREAQRAINGCVEAFFGCPHRVQALKHVTAELFGLPTPVVSPAPVTPPDVAAMEPYRRAVNDALTRYPLK